MGWMPIETAPKDGTVILITSSISRKPIACMAHYSGEDGLGFEWRLYDQLLWDDMPKEMHGMIGWQGDPTHWMPLPKPPAD